MIGQLKGTIAHISNDTIILDCNGVGYLVSVSSQILHNYGMDEACLLWVETRMRENEITLYGFASEKEKSLFNLVTSVQGVGAKAGMAILSVLSPDDLLLAISSADSAAITRANGVGPKIANRIIAELKDKTGAVVMQAGFAQAASAAKAKSGDKTPENNNLQLVQEVASALANLGYTPSEATRAASLALQQSEGGEASVENLIPLALKELSGA